MGSTRNETNKHAWEQTAVTRTRNLMDLDESADRGRVQPNTYLKKQIANLCLAVLAFRSVSSERHHDCVVPFASGAIPVVILLAFAPFVRFLDHIH